MKRWILVVLIALALVVIVGFTQIKLDALQEPGSVETFLATQVKHLLVRRSSRQGIPPAPTNLQASIEEGDKIYATECSMCHGPDGTPTDSGRWMSPRASDLTSSAVQRYSDPELFWIVKNGIRLSGDACVWKGRIRRTHLEFGALSKDSPEKRPSGERSYGLKSEMIGRCFWCKLEAVGPLAVARRLAIDLWRWAIGRASAQTLGLQLSRTMTQKPSLSNSRIVPGQ
jgi:mono/diheme cytochrome c family protein